MVRVGQEAGASSYRIRRWARLHGAWNPNPDRAGFPAIQRKTPIIVAGSDGNGDADPGTGTNIEHYQNAVKILARILGRSFGKGCIAGHARYLLQRFCPPGTAIPCVGIERASTINTKKR
jgi:hypothetical protein